MINNEETMKKKFETQDKEYKNLLKENNILKNDKKRLEKQVEK